MTKLTNIKRLLIGAQLMEKKMTPCEKLGYKVGDRFEVIDPERVTGNCSVGDIIILHRDDGTTSPFFRKEGRYFAHDCGYFEAIKPLEKLDNTLKPGDTIERDGKKYHVALEEIPQYDFKPGMMCRVVWDGVDSACPMHSDCTRVIHVGNRSAGQEYIAYSCTNGYLAIGYVNTSSLRPE